jgi:hypothetical protein
MDLTEYMNKWLYDTGEALKKTGSEVVSNLVNQGLTGLSDSAKENSNTPDSGFFAQLWDSIKTGVQKSNLGTAANVNEMVKNPWTWIITGLVIVIILFKVKK